MDCYARLEELLQLKLGWYDNVSGLPIAANVVEAVRLWLAEFADRLPYLYPTIEGGIEAEWDNGINVTFNPNGEVEGGVFGEDYPYVLIGNLAAANTITRQLFAHLESNAAETEDESH